MLELKLKRLREELEKVHAGLQRQAQKDVGAVERRLGKWLGRFQSAERLLQVSVERDKEGQAVGLKIVERMDKAKWAQHAHGAYLLRTNCLESDPAKVWRWYMQLTQVEDAFRISKSDLSLRPVYHQKTERVEAHILVCFLSLAMWRSLEMWMKGKSLGDSARQLVKEVATVRSVDVVMPMRSGGAEAEVRMRVVGRPDRSVAELLVQLGLELPLAPRRVQNVVEKTSA